jgi:type III pantothenate kinase
MLSGRKFPTRKEFFLTFVDACGVDLETDRRWEQAWDRLYPERRERQEHRAMTARAETDEAAAALRAHEAAAPKDRQEAQPEKTSIQQTAGAESRKDGRPKGGPATLLTIDIRDSSTVLGVFDGDRMVEHWQIGTVPDRRADELAVVLHGLLADGKAFAKDDIHGISLCSTVPSVLREMREMCLRYYGDLATLIVEPGVRMGVPVRTDNPQEVGCNRIMNSLAAVHLYGGPAMVVDFGTSTSFDAVSARGEFVGGALAPGIEISADALSRRAPQPLKVELTRPPHVIGKNTTEELQSGIIYGFAAQVEGIASRMARELSPDNPDAVTTIVTGGLAPLVLDEMSGIDAYEPWLTLIGLRLVFEKNMGRSDFREHAGPDAAAGTAHRLGARPGRQWRRTARSPRQ